MDEFGVRDQIEKPIRTIQTHARQNILNHTIYQFLLNYIYFRLNIEDIFFPALYMMMMRDGPRYGFWVRCRRGWQVTKLGIKVVRADPELMVYMFFSAMFSIGAFVVLMTSTGTTKKVVIHQATCTINDTIHPTAAAAGLSDCFMPSNA